MSVTSPATLADHIDFLVLQPDEERSVVRDLMAAVLAFNAHGRGGALQISFPLFTDAKVTRRQVLGPCVRVTGPAERLYVLTLRYEISAHLRAGRAMTLVRDQIVVDAGRFEHFNLLDQAQNMPAVSATRTIVLSGQSRLIEMAGRMGVTVDNEAVFVARGESVQARSGIIDLLGFSATNTVPIIR